MVLRAEEPWDLFGPTLWNAWVQDVTRQGLLERFVPELAKDIGLTIPMDVAGRLEHLVQLHTLERMSAGWRRAIVQLVAMLATEHHQDMPQAAMPAAPMPSDPEPSASPGSNAPNTAAVDPRGVTAPDSGQSATAPDSGQSAPAPDSNQTATAPDSSQTTADPDAVALAAAESLLADLQHRRRPYLHINDAHWQRFTAMITNSERRHATLGSIARELALSWPSTREHEPLSAYLDHPVSQLVQLHAIGAKKARTIVLCVVHEAVELMRRIHAFGADVAADRDRDPEPGIGPAIWIESVEATYDLEHDAELTVQDILEPALQSLDPRGREVLTRRLGLARQTPERFSAIGVSHGISRERVRQLQETALKILRYDKLLLRRLAAWLERDATAVWNKLATQDDVVRRGAVSQELPNRLDPWSRLAIKLLYDNVEDWLDDYATAAGRGWHRSSIDPTLLDRLVSLLDSDEIAFPTPADAVAMRYGASPLALGLAVALSRQLYLYDGYLCRDPSSIRERNAVWLHRFLCSMGDDAEPQTASRLTIHYKRERPGATCSYRGVVVALKDYPHLFARGDKGKWTAIEHI